MTKLEFILALHDKLSGLPQEDVEERLRFYSEMIEDRMEDGLSEDAAVAEVGNVDEIAGQILSEIPFNRLITEKIKSKRRLTAWEIVLLSLGAPVWGALLVAALAVVFSLWASLWSVVVSLWSVFVSAAACAFGGVAGGLIFVISGNTLPGVAVIGGALVCAGLSIFLFYGCKAATKGAVWLTKKFALGIKKCFLKKEAAE